MDLAEKERVRYEVYNTNRELRRRIKRRRKRRRRVRVMKTSEKNKVHLKLL